MIIRENVVLYEIVLLMVNACPSSLMRTAGFESIGIKKKRKSKNFAPKGSR